MEDPSRVQVSRFAAVDPELSVLELCRSQEVDSPTDRLHERDLTDGPGESWKAPQQSPRPLESGVSELARGASATVALAVRRRP